ncbi:MAG TPA: hypothetical protein VHG09_00510 [Longimicrobiales bacterium]|nr:hypothetical protein [Longimicrobiales bacterium]
MLELAERAYFRVCLALGRLLRSARYSNVRFVSHEGVVHVHKRRALYAPLLVWLGDPLVRMLDTGVRVLPQREWEERERLIYRNLYGTSIRIEGDRTLVLPCLPGQTLANLLEKSELETSARNSAIELAVVALGEFHRAGFTHGDAMAENVMVDLETGVARWFDFETVHDPGRPIEWRRADDLRALIATCLLRSPHADVAETVRIVLDSRAGEEAVRLVAVSFASAFRRSLPFHLGQAPLSCQDYHELGRLLGERFRRHRM